MVWNIPTRSMVAFRKHFHERWRWETRLFDHDPRFAAQFRSGASGHIETVVRFAGAEYQTHVRNITTDVAHSSAGVPFSCWINAGSFIIIHGEENGRPSSQPPFLRPLWIFPYRNGGLFGGFSSFLIDCDRPWPWPGYFHLPLSLRHSLIPVRDSFRIFSRISMDPKFPIDFDGK